MHFCRVKTTMMTFNWQSLIFIDIVKRVYKVKDKSTQQPDEP